MRVALYVVLLMTALWCVVGALGFTGYLVAVTARSVRDRRRGVKRAIAPPPRGLVALLIGYACLMAATAAAMVWAQVPFWVAMASWSALGATVTAAVLRQRRSPTAS